MHGWDSLMNQPLVSEMTRNVQHRRQTVASKEKIASTAE
jgi:hypothetical protein